MQKVKKARAEVTAVAGFVVAIVGLIKVIRDEASLMFWIVCVAGSLLLWGSLFWIRFRVVTIDRRLSEPIREFAYSKQARLWALLGIFAVPVAVGLASTGVWWHAQRALIHKTIVLVADFEGPDNRYKVTETLLSRLRRETSEYKDIEIKALGEPITERNGGRLRARASGESHHASIVLWGWYGVPRDTGLVAAHFEILLTRALSAKGQ
ncbi:MAG: hypothetical protein ACR2GR_08715, partial [Rhodothermales bacterium]